MKPGSIEKIPIKQIRVVNPRSRNRQTFQGIVNSIRSVGLKKPITVARRNGSEPDGLAYDLVCGQGRLEALASLGARVIPAVVTSAPVKERYLMSLVENVARYQPPHNCLLKEVKRLKGRGYTNKEIASKLGFGHTYIEGILRLLRSGEEHLVAQVEAGTLPLTIAIQIATAGSEQVEKALSEAYEKGELRGGRFRTVQRMVASRLAKSESGKIELNLSREDLAQQYEEHTKQQRILVKRAALVHEQLALLAAAFKQLLADEEVVRVLRAEGLDSMPQQLAVRLG